MKYLSIASVTAKSAMTPSRMGRIASMLPGVLPSISFASWPTATTLRLLPLVMATTDGSSRTIPRPRMWTSVLAVPRSMAMSCENMPRNRSNTATDLSILPFLVEALPDGLERVEVLDVGERRHHVLFGRLVQRIDFGGADAQ